MGWGSWYIPGEMFICSMLPASVFSQSVNGTLDFDMLCMAYAHVYNYRESSNHPKSTLEALESLPAIQFQDLNKSCELFG